ncbi:MAG: ECF transporter S component [Tissierellia bacterium]|nr:ECF transporter S component [Tissierellia bacterium]MDD4725813.1 ECF transporter S component [Tissierellia bacterium]
MLAVKDKRKEGWSTKVMAKISVLSVISFLLMFFEFPIVWLAPAFMEFDISDLPALIGAFAMGPMAGVIIELIKNILNVVVKGTTTAVVGEVANFVVGSAFVFTAGLVYQRKKSYKNAVMGLILGTIAMTAVISLANYYVMFPFYANLFGLPIEELIGMGTAINENIVDLKTMMVYAVVPFNLVKGTIVSVLAMLVYKRVSPLLHK